MNGFVRQLRQSVDEALHGVTDAVGKRLEDAGTKVADAAQAAGDEIRGALSNYADHSKSLNSALGRHVQATEKLSARIEAIEVPVDLLDRRITPALEKIVTLVDAKLNEIRAHAAGGQEGVMQAQMAMLNDLREKVTGQLAAFETQLAQLRAESLSALQQSRKAWDEEVKQAQAASREVTQQLTSMVQTLAHELGNSGSQSAR
jgi:chromosome segregation ATPase